MAKQLTYSITGISSGKLDSLTLREAYTTPVAALSLVCSETSLGLGDSITANIGYDGSNTKIFTGFVSKVENLLPDNLITVQCEDVLAKATNYFIASNDPESPLKYSNILSQDYVQNILALAEITNFESIVPLNFTWATDLPAEVNLITAWEAAREMADILAWHIYADRNGKVWFADRKPYIMGGDSPTLYWDETAGTDVTSLRYTKSTEELRNKVVVYGRKGINAVASQSSSHLYSSTYYKTAVIAHPLIQTQSQAQTAADYNLAMYNRLTEVLSMTVEGNPNIAPRKIAQVTGSAFSGIGTADWFILQVNHTFNTQGYTVDMTLSK